MSNTDRGAPEYEFDWQNPNKKSFDFGRVLGRAFTGVFVNIKPLLIAVAITLIFTIVVSYISTSQLKEIVGSGDVEAIGAVVSSPGYWLWSIGSSIPALFFTLWLQLIVVETSYAEFTGTSQPPSPLTSTLKYILPMFVVSIIYVIVCMTGYVFFLIGFLFVWPGWALAGPILVHEKAGIFGSLGRAWTLSKGSKRWIFLLLFILLIIGIIVYLVMFGIAVVGTGVNMFSGDPTAALDMSIGQQVLMNVVMGLGGYFLYAVFASGLTAAYVEVKTMKEGAPTVGEVFS